VYSLQATGHGDTRHDQSRQRSPRVFTVYTYIIKGRTDQTKWNELK